MSKNNFKHPRVFGLVAARPNPALKKKMNAAFKRLGQRSVFLDLVAPPSMLKNVVKCMQLMDVTAVLVEKGYEKKIVKFIPLLDRSARSAGRANLIAKKGRSFIGYYLPGII
jgi:shikimate 5-dehydrogenase